ncbi:sigma-54 interaction domain-containing protein [Maledivibacter halophilus]|uniref:PAS domain S-box-containing protein n=1 Tax=Maledivibacter halophilus TaxID=36842 RepID=A0A1T5M5K9_9FIRM|nr:sigma 54-interacting transcriptional regulator [Maledivibacter halophilus]SKC83527.1 PAS domain S-box-containing protein [Maledivibacter halophilus]
MKKKLILITFEVAPKERYLKDLKDFFGEYIEIEGYSIKEGINKIIQGDLALISLSGLTNIAKEYLPDEMEIIYFNRTFKKGSFQQLYDLPSGTKAMLVNNSKIGAFDTISLLYEMGIKHVDFIPVYPNMRDIPDLKCAVTPGQTHHVPKNVEKIINIDWRVLDVSTLMSIISKLDILDEELDKKLENYLNTIVPISHGLHYIFKSSHEIKNKLNIILDVIDDGVIVIDEDYKVIHYNRSIEKILGINEESIMNKNVREIISSHPTMNEVLEEKYVEDLILKHDKTNKSLIITKRPIMDDNRIYGYVLIIKDKTEIENLENELRRQLVDRGYIAKYRFEDIVGVSDNIIESKNKAKKISGIEAPVIITGESGTGKELFAQAIHNNSKRMNKPFLGINCASLSSDLLESELFGYEEGAFTGARKGGKKGLFELAHLGSLFLDEISELPMYMQAKLLRVLQEKEVMRIGGMRIIPIDVRIIAATNRDLKKLVQEGKFRKDLYYRLNVLTLNLSPLRERKKDIPYLIKDIFKKTGTKRKKIDESLKEALINHYWDGNIRELKNCIEYMIYLGSDRLTVNDLPPDFKNEENHFKDKKENKLFLELTLQENKLALYILNILRYKPAGRRTIYKYAIQEGFDVSEHKVRKIMEFLLGKGIIKYGEGRTGAKLTKFGNDIISKKINLRDDMREL